MTHAVGRVRTALAGIAARLMAFNILIVFLPIAGFLSVGTYEKQLLTSLEDSLVQQGRVLAASLEDSPEGLHAGATRIITHLRQRHDARLRVVDAQGTLLADSSSLTQNLPATPRGTPTQTPETGRVAQSTFLYRLALLPVRVWRSVFRPPALPPTDADEYYGSARTLSGPEIRDALAGGYGATTRISKGQQSVTLYSAIPILGEGRVVGAVVVSQSTGRILGDLSSLRLDIFRVFLWSVGTSLLLSFLLSVTVTVPLRKLRDQARGVIDARGRLAGVLTPAHRRDEIGDLSRSLGTLTEKLSRHVQLLETFASDVSHELKNPLASIRSALELAQTEGSIAEREELLTMALDDVSRMERLLSGVREISRIDAGTEDEGFSITADLRLLAERAVAAQRLREHQEVRFRVAGPHVGAVIPPQRALQVLDNLIDNALSFSPAGGEVRIEVSEEAQQTRIRVSDEGPGILPEHAERIFERFFSFRPGEENGHHAGLGLAIVKSIAESCGGSVRAFNRPARGACVEVRLPAYSRR
ncbi:MAG TPA: ATP-binding protein [Spirochaetia bacterium]|nr:ATP-binding protein [Spirochaetia bacterium]